MKQIDDPGLVGREAGRAPCAYMNLVHMRFRLVDLNGSARGEVQQRCRHGLGCQLAAIGQQVGDGRALRPEVRSRWKGGGNQRAPDHVDQPGSDVERDAAGGAGGHEQLV